MNRNRLWRIAAMLCAIVALNVSMLCTDAYANRYQCREIKCLARKSVNGKLQSYEMRKGDLVSRRDGWIVDPGDGWVKVRSKRRVPPMLEPIPARSLTWSAALVHLPAVVPSMTECLSGKWICQLENCSDLRMDGPPYGSWIAPPMGAVADENNWRELPPENEGDGGWYCY